MAAPVSNAPELSSSVLPPHAHVVAGPDVWMEGAAIDQLARVAASPGCVKAVGLPDLHPGPGIPIGAVFAFHNIVRPALVGGDAGCGVRLVALPKGKLRGDALERRVDEATQGPALPDACPAALLHAVWRDGPRGLAHVKGVPDTLQTLAAACPAQAPTVAPPPDLTSFGAALGTIGGGNHFLELGEVTAVQDRDRAKALGLKRGGQAILAHSGSRGLGRWLLEQWAGAVLEGDDVYPYLASLHGAVAYARANRLVLTWRMLKALGAASPGRHGPAFDLVHNDVRIGVVNNAPAWIHRKGAAPAEGAQPTVVLGSRGTPSHVMLGSGSQACLCSVAHGAGRRMGRSEAIAKLKHRHTRASARRTGGGRVLCDDTALLFAEHPDAYKAIDPIIASLSDAGAATPVASISPRITVKR